MDSDEDRWLVQVLLVFSSAQGRGPQWKRLSGSDGLQEVGPGIDEFGQVVPV